MANAVRAGVGGTPPGPGRTLGVLVAPTDSSPLLARVGLQVERSELVHAEHDRWITWARRHGAVGDGVELEDPVLLGLEVTVVGALPGLHRLKRHALLSEQGAQALMADVVDHPLSHEVVGKLRQRPRRERTTQVSGSRQSDLLDRLSLGQRE